MAVLVNANYLTAQTRQVGWLVVMTLEHAPFKLELRYDPWGMGVFTNVMSLSMYLTVTSFHAQTRWQKTILILTAGFRVPLGEGVTHT